MKSVFSRRKEGKLIIAWIFTGLIITSIGLWIAPFLVTLSTNSAIQANPHFHDPRVATSAPPIFINGTDPSNDWDKCPWVNGTGTYGNPYVIQDLIIDGGETQSCISISNTREYFRIENCSVMNSGTSSTDAGISLVNSSNGIIFNNNCTQNPRYGILLVTSNNNTLELNNCTMNQNGICLSNSDNNTLRANHCTTNAQMGIDLYASNNILNRNNCSENEVGIHLFSSYNNQLDGNLCLRNIKGINLVAAHVNTIIGNNCTSNTYGIVLNYARFCNVTANNCTGNVYGISLQITFEDFIISNNCTGNSVGISVEDSKNNTLCTNTCTKSSSRPILEVNSNGNDIHHNWFWTNPIASFIWNTTQYTPEIWVAFNDTTLGDAPLTYQWNFGDGTENSTLKDPIHQYVSPGFYIVTLMVEDFDGDISIHQFKIEIPADWIWLVIALIIVTISLTGIGGIVVVRRKWGPKLVRIARRFKQKSQQHTSEIPYPHEVTGVARKYVDVLRQYEYMGGKVRLKVKVVNAGKVGLLRILCMLNLPNSFRLLRIEPREYSAEGSTVKMQDLLPKEEKAVAYVLEPLICGKEQFSGIVSGMDSTGIPFALPLAPLEVEVRCPLFATPEEANIPLVKNMVPSMPVKSERVFYLPETFAPATAFELAKAVISKRDVRFVGFVTKEDRKDNDLFDESAWFYGTTKIEKRRYVIEAAVSEKDRIIRLTTACDDEAGCTGFLAEAGAAVRQELVERGAYETEKDVIELVCEKCGATLPSAPTLDRDVRCPDCQWSWSAKDFF